LRGYLFDFAGVESPSDVTGPLQLLLCKEVREVLSLAVKLESFKLSLIL
jgi:hypothetical protein